MLERTQEWRRENVVGPYMYWNSKYYKSVWYATD